MSETRYHDIPMSEAAAATLHRLERAAGEAGGRAQVDPSLGPLLYALSRATQPYRLLVLSDNPSYTTLWLALGATVAGRELHIVTESNGAHLQTSLRDSGLDELPLTVPSLEALDSGEPYDLLLLDHDALYYAANWQQLRNDLSPRALVVAVGALQQAERIDAFQRALEQAEWRQLLIDRGGGLLLAAHAAQPPQYEESPQERFVALFLQVVQPENVVLGPNVVFDGAMKPPTSAVNFSGTGGQVGIGDLLIVHPQDLQRFTPLPGAVALVLGELPEAIQTPNVVLPLGDEVVTLVVR